MPGLTRGARCAHRRAPLFASRDRHAQCDEMLLQVDRQSRVHLGLAIAAGQD